MYTYKFEYKFVKDILRWLDRCLESHSRDDQALFPIIQGGLDFELRKKCIAEMAKRAKVGIAIGGLSGGIFLPI